MADEHFLMWAGLTVAHKIGIILNGIEGRQILAEPRQDREVATVGEFLWVSLVPYRVDIASVCAGFLFGRSRYRGAIHPGMLQLRAAPARGCLPQSQDRQAPPT